MHNSCLNECNDYHAIRPVQLIQMVSRKSPLEMPAYLTCLPLARISGLTFAKDATQAVLKIMDLTQSE